MVLRFKEFVAEGNKTISSPGLDQLGPRGSQTGVRNAVSDYRASFTQGGGRKSLGARIAQSARMRKPKVSLARVSLPD